MCWPAPLVMLQSGFFFFKSFQNVVFHIYSLGLNGSCCIQSVLEYVVLPLTWLLLLAYIASGGRDRRGGPVLTFPSRSNHDRIRTEDLRRLIAYLAGIPRLHIHYICPPGVCTTGVFVCAAGYLKMRRSNSSNQTLRTSRWGPVRKHVTKPRWACEGRIGKEIIQDQLAPRSFLAAKNPSWRCKEMLRQRGESLGRERETHRK